MNSDSVKHPKSYEEFLMIVGELVVEYSKAEMNVALLVNELTQSKRGIKIYSDNLNSEQKIKNYIKELSKYPHPSSFESIKILKKLNKCRVERYQIAHSLWMHYLKIGSQNIFSSISFDKKSKDFVKKKKTIEEIKDALVKIKKVSGDIAVEFGEVTVLKRK